jgi:hypothetical protein
MADELDKETKELTNFAKKYKESMSETNDLASQMLQTFKDINGILDKNTKNIDKSRSFQKQILSDAKARAIIEDQINSNIASAEKELLQMKLAQIDNSKFLNELGKEYAGVTEKITVSENNLIFSKKKLSKIDNDILESEKSKSAILAKQQNLIEKIEKYNKSIQVTNASILTNKEAIVASQAKESMALGKIQGIEEEIAEAQRAAIHDGIVDEEAYDKLLRRHAMAQRQFNIAKDASLGLIATGAELEKGHLILTTDLKKIQDEIIEGNKELLPIDRALVENREKQRIATNGILDLEGELNSMMKEKAKL